MQWINLIKRKVKMTEIFIQKNNEGERKIALVENGILLEYYEEEDKETRKEGNIYRNSKRHCRRYAISICRYRYRKK